MSDLSLFMQQGWRNIWKQKIIWLFSALPLITRPVLNTFQRGEQNIAILLLYLALNIVASVLGVISLIGVPYLAYRFSTGGSATIQETLGAVRRFSGRIIGCSCIVILLFLPVFLLAFGIALRNSPASQAISIASLVIMPLSIFSCLWSFVTFGFFENDWGIRKSIENAWNLFTSHFGTLAILGTCLVLIFRLSSGLIGVLTVLIQSGFDMASLVNLNFVNPSMTLGKNPIFLLLNGINQILYATFSTSVFVLAYLKYHTVNNGSHAI